MDSVSIDKLLENSYTNVDFGTSRSTNNWRNLGTFINNGDRTLDQCVNDRSYVASSFLSVAIARVLGSALAGRSKDRLELIETRLRLTAKISVLPRRGGEGFLRRDQFNNRRGCAAAQCGKPVAFRSACFNF